MAAARHPTSGASGGGVTVGTTEYVSTPSKPLSKLLTRIKYVPLTGTMRLLAAIASTPATFVSTVPFGAYTRSHGRTSSVSDVCVTCTLSSWPKGTLIVHTPCDVRE
jgi:hypothetical protein